MAVFYGSDSYCLTDVGLTDVQVTDPNILIGQRIARLLQTPRGGFAAIGDDPNRGWDVRQYVNMKMTPATIAQAQQQTANECLKDEEVKSADVIFTVSGGALQAVTINLVGASGPFQLTANVQQITSDLVFAFSS